MNYGLIGAKLGHSFSKEIHAMISDYDYRLYEMTEEELISRLKAKDFKAVNITIPYKQTVIPFLDEISDAAKSIGAVNCIRNDNGRLIGHNTDFDGLKALIRHAKIDVKNKSVLILGTGGSSNTAYAAAHSLGAKRITKVSRSGKNGAITYEQAKVSGADVIINTTPCGMYPDCGSKPLELSDYENLSGVCDLIFNPLRTMLVLEARQSGIPAEGGLYMLVLQAVRAYEFFTGDKCTDGLCEKIFKALTKQKQNIVLTGMPASGKSTVGKIIAKRLSRDFIDIDDEIVRSEGRSIPRIFAESGEEYFRDAETKAILEASKRTGAVIATGGGAVLRSENITALKQNGRIYFRDRALGSLIPTSDRPTADSSDALAKRYEERYPIYVKTADFTVTAQDTAEHAADQIEEDFSK